MAEAMIYLAGNEKRAERIVGRGVAITERKDRAESEAVIRSLRSRPSTERIVQALEK